MSDDLVFSDEHSGADQAKHLTPWQVLVVDDDPAVHEVTKLVMAGFEVVGRTLEFSHCYSSEQARGMLAEVRTPGGERGYEILSVTYI